MSPPECTCDAHASRTGPHAGAWGTPPPWLNVAIRMQSSARRCLQGQVSTGSTGGCWRGAHALRPAYTHAKALSAQGKGTRAVCRALTRLCGAGALRGLLRAGARGPQVAKRARVRPQRMPTQRQACSTAVVQFPMCVMLCFVACAPRALRMGSADASHRSVGLPASEACLPPNASAAGGERPPSRLSVR